MLIDYDHSSNCHTVEGAKATLSILLNGDSPKSLLDVGCGTGTWLKAALDLGVQEVRGIDGVPIAEEQLLIPSDNFQVQDINKAWCLKKSFDIVLCLEVAEHLEAGSESILIDCLVAHGDTILFSAACPGQPGQHHVNCQWPEFWQQLFNERGYVCDDAIRWRIWNEEGIEPWYRQNLFVALRDPIKAFGEPRIKPVVHPRMVASFEGGAKKVALSQFRRKVATGGMPVGWYVTVPLRGLYAKFARNQKG